MDFVLAESGAEGDVLVRRQVLTAKQQDTVVQVRPMDLREGFAVNRLRQVDALNFGADSVR